MNALVTYFSASRKRCSTNPRESMRRFDRVDESEEVSRTPAGSATSTTGDSGIPQRLWDGEHVMEDGRRELIDGFVSVEIFETPSTLAGGRSQDQVGVGGVERVG